MRPDDLADLIAGGESFTVEFKSTANDTDLVEAVTCLANGRGGRVLVGVKDDGTIIGAPHRHGDSTDAARVQSLIANKTEPAVITAVEIVVVEGKDVLVVEVRPSDSVVGTVDGRFVRRATDIHGKPQCLPMRPHEVVARAGSVGAQDYSRIPVREAMLSDLSPVEFARLRELASTGGDAVLSDLSDQDILKALGLIDHRGELTVGALLLFGREESIARFIPTHEVAFQVLESSEVRINNIGRAPLLRAMVELTDAVRAYNPEEEIQVGLFRVGLPRYAEIAVRELVSNALVHRDYTRLGAVLVQLDDQNLAVSNPGGFPEGVTVENLLIVPPRPRNPVLADVFKRAGLVERTGRGINRVYLSQLMNGRPAPDYGRSTEGWVEARLRAGPADRALAGFIAESRQIGEQFLLQDLLALHEVRVERRITSGRAAELFQVGVDEAALTVVRTDRADYEVAEREPTPGGRTRPVEHGHLADRIVRVAVQHRPLAIELQEIIRTRRALGLERLGEQRVARRESGDLLVDFGDPLLSDGLHLAHRAVELGERRGEGLFP